MARLWTVEWKSYTYAICHIRLNVRERERESRRESTVSVTLTCFKYHFHSRVRVDSSGVRMAHALRRDVPKTNDDWFKIQLLDAWATSYFDYFVSLTFRSFNTSNPESTILLWSMTVLLVSYLTNWNKNKTLFLCRGKRGDALLKKKKLKYICIFVKS